MSIWIDTDMGFDDIAAILVVRDAGICIDGISLVFGNTALDQVRRNAAGASRAFGWSMPFYVGRSTSVVGLLETAEAILGANGIPSVGRELPVSVDLPEEDAFLAMCRWIEETPSPHRILALGPLTNIAALALARPDLASRIDDLTWMGGGLTRGNHTASAEFNAFADPEAVAIVLAHGLPLRMVELDFCRTILARPSDVEPIRSASGRNSQLIADLLAGFIDIAVSRGRSAMALYDPAAAVAFIRPDLVSFTAASIEMECAGSHTRGRTVVETRATHASFNAQIASTCDSGSIKDLVMAALCREAQK